MFLDLYAAHKFTILQSTKTTIHIKHCKLKTMFTMHVAPKIIETIACFHPVPKASLDLLCM